MTRKKYTYKNTGVDIEAGTQTIEKISAAVRETYTSNVLSDIGGFGGFFMPDFQNYKEPVLVSSTDGAGTKLIVAFKAQKYDTIGRDLVNHCVNDIAVCGADPLFFLDYFSTGKLDSAVALKVIQGFAEACNENGVALIGGETAEMPDLYDENTFDLAGTIVGVVDRHKIIDGTQIKKGDILLGFPSSGLHTNGYSLARKVLFAQYNLNEKIAPLGATLADELLTIHKSYLHLIKKLRELEGVHGFSHITGGGIVDNTTRILPAGAGCSLKINWDAWPRPPVFGLIQQAGNVPEADMRRTFNLGIGLIAVIDEKVEKRVMDKAIACGEIPVKMGFIQ